jgi:hypothetical protein
MTPLFSRGLRVLLVSLSLASALATRAAEPTLPPLVRAPTDQAQFRRFVLDSGLKVLLVSDPKFDKSGAALVMPIGQIDDPADREGMAHFLEHMLFLGTAKYPEANAYGNFMQSNGGYHNAYTASDHTNYQFEVRHEALAEGLDRFAQFFIAPLFTPEFTGREINAVHNEAMRHVQNDGRRLFSVCRELYAPGSGESKFSTGNKDTLAGATPRRSGLSTSPPTPPTEWPSPSAARPRSTSWRNSRAKNSPLCLAGRSPRFAALRTFCPARRHSVWPRSSRSRRCARCSLNSWCPSSR